MSHLSTDCIMLKPRHVRVVLEPGVQYLDHVQQHRTRHGCVRHVRLLIYNHFRLATTRTVETSVEARNR